jgi:hypothetical protein
MYINIEGIIYSNANKYASTQYSSHALSCAAATAMMARKHTDDNTNVTQHLPACVARVQMHQPFRARSWPIYSIINIYMLLISGEALTSTSLGLRGFLLSRNRFCARTCPVWHRKPPSICPTTTSKETMHDIHARSLLGSGACGTRVPESPRLQLFHSRFNHTSWRKLPRRR